MVWWLARKKKIYISQTSEHLGAVTPPTTRGLLRVDTENEPILPLFFHCSGCVQSVRHADFFLVHRFLFSFPTHKSRPLARSTLPVRVPAARGFVGNPSFVLPTGNANQSYWLCTCCVPRLPGPQSLASFVVVNAGM